MEIIANLKMESLKSAGNEASVVAPQQVLALPPPPPQSSTTTQLPTRTSSISSNASFTSSSSSVVTPTNKVTPSQNGDTHTAFETKHETVVS